MQALVELVAGLLVEVFRERQQWWSNRARLRAAAAREASPAQSPPVDVEPLVVELLVRHARRHVGVAVGVQRGDRSWFVSSETVGPGRPSPPCADTIFEIGSVTKVFTATLLAALVEDGTMSLHDPVQSYLPADVELPVRGRPVTLADLATHTAGLPRLPHRFIRHSLRHRRNPYAWFTVDDLYAGLPDTRLRREPGGAPRYSNLGYGLLGRLGPGCESPASSGRRDSSAGPAPSISAAIRRGRSRPPRSPQTQLSRAARNRSRCRRDHDKARNRSRCRRDHDKACDWFTRMGITAVAIEVEPAS